MDFTIRHANEDDFVKIFNLYKQVSKFVGGIAREEDEISINYINDNLRKALKSGKCLVVADAQNELIAEIHCYKLEPRVFQHILSELTIVVHPDFQNKGIGKSLFTKLLMQIEEDREDILRVELIARESNTNAIRLYQKLGFEIEGRLKCRIDNKSGQFESDIPMAWINKNFSKKNLL